MLFSAGATLLACLKSNIYELVGDSSIFSLVSLFIPLLFGLYWRNMSRAGAMAAMVSGMASWIYFIRFPVSVPALVPALAISAVAAVVVSWMVSDRRLSQHQ